VLRCQLGKEGELKHAFINCMQLAEPRDILDIVSQPGLPITIPSRICTKEDPRGEGGEGEGGHPGGWGPTWSIKLGWTRIAPLLPLLTCAFATLTDMCLCYPY